MEPKILVHIHAGCKSRPPPDWPDFITGFFMCMWQLLRKCYNQKMNPVVAKQVNVSLWVLFCRKPPEKDQKPALKSHKLQSRDDGMLQQVVKLVTNAIVWHGRECQPSELWTRVISTYWGFLHNFKRLNEDYLWICVTIKIGVRFTFCLLYAVLGSHSPMRELQNFSRFLQTSSFLFFKN